MNKKTLYIFAGFITLVLIVGMAYVVYQSNLISVDGRNNPTPVAEYNNQPRGALLYNNAVYEFSVPLPESWRGYTVTEKTHDSYIEISIKHPQSTPENPRMNIPVLVIPITTWNTWYPVDGEGNHPFAAPIPATERARNTKYIFATAPRYNYSFAMGYEEVDEIVRGIVALSVVQ